jgi:YbbR domain-containing protein
MRHRYSIAGLIWLVAIGCWLLACSLWLIANSHKLKAMSTLAMRPGWGYNKN